MVITDIAQQRKNADRASVYLDGAFAFGLTTNLLWEHHLKIGQELTEAQVADLKRADALAQVYDKAIGLIARRPRSVMEVRQYLRRKLIYEHPEAADAGETFRADQEATITTILDLLVERRHLDDVAFAKWWIDNRRSFKPRGKRLLLLELQTKGISMADIGTALTTPDDVGHFSSERRVSSEDEQANLVAAQYRKRHPDDGTDAYRNRFSRHLASKGFDWDTIKIILDAAKDNP